MINMANVGEVSVGDKVTTTATHDVNGTSLASFVRTTTYDVIQVGGDGLPDTRIVIGLGSAVTAAVDISTLTIIGGSKSIKSEDTPKVEYKEYAMTSKGIEDYLTNMLKNLICCYCWIWMLPNQLQEPLVRILLKMKLF